MYKEENWDSLPSWNEQELKEAALGWEEENVKAAIAKFDEGVKKAEEDWESKKAF